MILVLKFFAAFWIGAIPFAKVAMLGTGIDITKVGSKNPGFRNVTRFASWWRAAICLIGDVGKGYLALLLLRGADTSAIALWGIGVASVMGHCWSPFLGFNGGKGVATTFGVLLYLQPLNRLVPASLSDTSNHWRQTQTTAGRRDRVAHNGHSHFRRRLGISGLRAWHSCL